MAALLQSRLKEVSESRKIQIHDKGFSPASIDKPLSILILSSK